jgi:hypothetical protein
MVFEKVPQMYESIHIFTTSSVMAFSDPTPVSAIGISADSFISQNVYPTPFIAMPKHPARAARMRSQRRTSQILPKATVCESRRLVSQVQDPRFTRRGITPKAGVHVLARYLCNYFRRKEEEKCSRDVVQDDKEKGFVSLGL